jgi:hypothetical protein
LQFNMCAALRISLMHNMFANRFTQNPNRIPAAVNNIDLLVMQKDISGEEKVFAKIHVPGGFKLPPSGSVTVNSTMVVESAGPGLMAALVLDLKRNNGTLVTRALAVMDLQLMWQSVVLHAECLQHLKLAQPMRVTKIDCQYYLGAHKLPMLPGRPIEDNDA